MPINCNYSGLAKSIKTINNPNLPVGTLIEEIPTDIGRSWEGYKRGGILEGAEKMRKELMTAAVWMAGIPAFNWLGNVFCEKVLKIPTKNIDFSDALKGNDAILDTANYLVNGTKKAGLDYSEVEHFLKNKKLDFKNTIAKSLAKKIKNAKMITSFLAVILNCVMMGVVIPKINQRMTEKKLKEQQNKTSKMKDFVSFDDFRKDNKKNSSNVSFGKNFFEGIPKNPNDFTYATENNNRFRLLVTDIPMIIGRMATSRNKYEALEYLIMDGTSAYFYNFSCEHIQKLLRNKTTPDIQPVTLETLINNPKELSDGMKKIDTLNIFDIPKDKRPDVVLKNIFKDEIANEIYKNETHGKYGKANRYVANSNLEDINNNVIGFLKHIKKQAEKQNVALFNERGELNTDFVNNVAKKVRTKNAIFLGVGLGISILGLSVIIPKMTFLVTKLLTGKNEFTGIAKYDDKDDSKNNDKKNENNK